MQQKINFHPIKKSRTRPVSMARTHKDILSIINLWKLGKFISSTSEDNYDIGYRITKFICEENEKRKEWELCETI